MKKILVLISILLFSSSLIFSQNVNTGGKEDIILKGFISTTLFGQDQSFGFGNGQNAEWTETNHTQNKWFYGGDIRNTRLTMVFNGPEITSNWKLGGVLELDAFGGFNGTGAFSPEQPVPRIRLAYADIIHDNLTLRIGQAWDPLFGNVPVSLSHIAFPLGYGSAGDVGWRFPGIFLYYKFDANSSPTQFGFDAAVFEGSWNGPGSTVNYMDGGNTGTPQFELRLNLDSKISDNSKISAYVVGHYNQVNLTAVNDTPKVHLTGTAIEVGANLKAGDFLVQGNLYTGQNVGHQFGNLTQFSAKADSNLKSLGYWLQAGYSFTKEWSLYAYYGAENMNNKSEVETILGNGARLESTLYDVMLKFSAGPWGLGLEWLQNQSKTWSQSGEGSYFENNHTGTQIAFSSMYSF
jgi:hypothetical protein